MVLMAEARAVSNPDLATLGPILSKPSREKLLGLGAIELGKSGRSMTLELSDKGWKLCADLMGSEMPRGVTGAGKALFTVLAGLRRWYDREDARPAEMFFAPAEAPLEDLGTLIRRAYSSLASEPGAYVRLSRLRPALGDVSRADVDAALSRLQRESGVNLIPEENQKTLTDEDRDASVVVGNQHNHLLAIHS